MSCNLINTLELEKNLIKSLDNHGIKNFREFSLVSAKLKSLKVDFYIPYPMRAFVEFTIFQEPKADIINKKKLSIINDRMKKYYDAFETAIVPILITNKKISIEEKHLFVDMPILFLEIPNNVSNAGDWCAVNIKEYMETNIKSFEKNRNTKYFFDKFELNDAGKFAHYLISFRSILKEKDFNILKDEIFKLNDEIKSEHYTAAALRVGRALELIIITLAKSWNVEVDVKTIQEIESINQSIKEIENILIKLKDATDENRSQIKKEFRIKKNALDAQFDLLMISDNEITLKVKNLDETPMNPRTVLKDVRSKYRNNKIIKEQIGIILNDKDEGDSIYNNLYKLRNEAAHANVSGKIKEIDKDKVDIMTNELNIILFHLQNINTLIVGEDN